MEDETKRAIEILKKPVPSIVAPLPVEKKHNLLTMMEDMIIVDNDTIPIPRQVLDRGIAEGYLAKCDMYMSCHESTDFRLYWGISPEDYPALYEDPIYSIARLCYLLTDCYSIQSWNQCWNHKGESSVNYVVSIDGVAKLYYNNLLPQLKTEIPNKRNVEEQCSLCKEKLVEEEN